MGVSQPLPSGPSGRHRTAVLRWRRRLGEQRVRLPRVSPKAALAATTTVHLLFLIALIVSALRHTRSLVPAAVLSGLSGVAMAAAVAALRASGEASTAWDRSRRTEFLATISHELRTPLTAVYGYAELLRVRGKLDPAAARMAERIASGATQLTRLVDDLRELSRIERGNLEVFPARVDLAPVLQDVVASFRLQAGGDRLSVEVPERLPAYADALRVAQAAGNFVVNALKYAPRGSIVLRGAPSPADGTMVRISVEDSGPGVAPADVPRVWETFYRSRAVAAETRGTGIGLAVVKAVVEAQGGRVGLDSVLGQGSTFWFEVPAAPKV